MRQAKKRRAFGEDENLFILSTTVVTGEQWDYIYELHERTHRTISSIIREAIDLFREKYKKDLDKFE